MSIAIRAPGTVFADMTKMVGSLRGARRMPAVSGYWVWSLVLTATLGSLFSALQVPSGWLIGALLSAGSVAVISGRELTPPRAVLRPAQGCIGVVAAAPLAGVATAKMAHYLGVSVICSGVTLMLCLACAFVLTRAAKTMSPATALLSTLAGGASGISTMAPELRVDHRYVALSQYLRLVVVTLTLPLVLQLASRPAAVTAHGGADRVSLVTTLTAAAVIGAAGYAGLRWKWPAPFLLAPMLAALLIGIGSQGQFVLGLPPAVNAVAYVVIGWQAGGSFTRSALRQFVRMLPLTCTFIGIAIGGCFGLAAAISAWAGLGLSMSQAYLATTPGGIYAVLAAANDSGAGPVVVTMQVFRLLVMVLTAIIATKILTGDHEVSEDPVRIDRPAPLRPDTLQLAAAA